MSVPLPKLTVEFIADTEVGGFTARVADIPAYGEGETKEEALTDLEEALRAYIEEFGLEDAMSRVSNVTIRSIAIDLKSLQCD